MRICSLSIPSFLQYPHNPPVESSNILYFNFALLIIHTFTK